MARQIFVDPVDGVSSFFRLNNVRDAQPRSAVVSSISGDTITLTSDSAADFFRLEMAGVSYVRIWNISKSPVEPAWVKAAPANNTLQVHDAAAIAGWSNGESIQIGDEDGFPGVLSGFGGGIAIDISPMMLTLFGVVFPQKAVSMKLTVFGNTGSARLSGSAAGSGGGSYIGISSQSNGGRADGVATVQTNVPSPISDSNLIFISEDGDPGGKIGLSLATCTGIWV